MMNTVTKREFTGYLRNFVFGVEDSLVSTVGLLSGIAAAGVARNTILLTGMVLIFVEAFSMAVGSYLSENTAEEYMADGAMASNRSSLISAVIMFVSYFISGLIPIFPYMFLGSATAFPISIALACLSLFTLGMVSGKILKINIWKNALKMFVMGGIAIAIGVLVGKWLKTVI